MKKYEAMYIIRPNVEGEAIKTIISNIVKIFTDRGGKIVQSKEIGLKELAYEINHHKKGYYVWHLIEANTEALNEFNRIVRINEDIIRDIIVSVEE